MGKRGPVALIDSEPEIVEKLLRLISAGNYIETAAAGVGVSRDTLYRWMKERPEFREQVQEATAKAEAIDLQRISIAAQSGIWQAAAWRLERRFPERWGRRDRPEVPEGKVTPTGIVVLPASRPLKDEPLPPGDTLGQLDS